MGLKPGFLNFSNTDNLGHLILVLCVCVFVCVEGGLLHTLYDVEQRPLPLCTNYEAVTHSKG